MDWNTWWAVNQPLIMSLIGMILLVHLMTWGLGRMIGTNLAGRLVRAEGRALRAIWRWGWNTLGDALRGITRWIGRLFGGGRGGGRR